MIYFDFEYYNSSEAQLTLVCAAARDDEGTVWQWWLHKDSQAHKDMWVQILKWLNKKEVFVSFGATAEIRSLLSLQAVAEWKGRPSGLQWLWDMDIIDLYAEWRMTQNHNNKYAYGRYFSASGGQRRSVPPKLNKKLNEGRDNKRISPSLAGCVGNLFGVNLDQQHKEAMRNLILSAPAQFAPEERAAIQKYCLDDTKHLPLIWVQLGRETARAAALKKTQVGAHALNRGKWAKSCALMERHGIPIKVEQVYNLGVNHDEISTKLIEKANSLYPWWVAVRKTKKDPLTYVFKTSQVEAWMEAHPDLAEKWPRTATGNYSTDEDTLEQYDGIPEIKLLRQTKKLLGQIKWFRPEEADRFYADIGKDDRLRPFFGPWGTQSSRNAPPAKRFPPAMSRWLRCIIGKPDTSIVGVDWSSQEFALAAILSGDEEMVEAYRSGDPYRYFAQRAGAIPTKGVEVAWIKNPSKAPKEQQEKYQGYADTRKLFKATVLGLQYGMGVDNLAKKLSADMGRKVPTSEADNLIELHKHTFETFWRWRKTVIKSYETEGVLALPDHWLIHGDNPNTLSVANFPLQGTGAVIMREAVGLALKKGLKVLFPLHDAIYIECEKGSTVGQEVETLEKCMAKAVLRVVGKGLEIRTEREIHNGDVDWVEHDGREVYQLMKPYLQGKKNVSDRTVKDGVD